MTVWITNWSDWSDNVRSLARTLRAAGVNCKTTDQTPYIGHRSLAIDKADLRKARSILRRMRKDHIVQAFTDYMVVE